MVANRSSEESLRFVSQQEAEKSTTVVEPSWNVLYKVGGISAILYMVLALVVPTLQVLTMDYFDKTAEYSGAEFLQFIAENRFWWFSAQTLLLGMSILAIVGFVALFVALKQIDKSYAILGAVFAVTTQMLFLAYYPVLLGTIYLSDKFVTASAAQQVLLGSAADSLIAINNGFNPLYEPIQAVGILFFSLAMLKGVFHKSIAYLGIATCAAALIGISLWPIVGVGYFWWWLLFFIWFVATGWKLYQMGNV